MMSFGLVILASCTIFTCITEYMTTYALNTLQVAAPLAFATTVVSNAVGIAGALLGGWLADRAGRRPIMIWPQIAALLMTYPVFLWIVESRGPMALLSSLGALTLVGTIPYSAFYVGMAEGPCDGLVALNLSCALTCPRPRNLPQYRPASQSPPRLSANR